MNINMCGRNVLPKFRSSSAVVSSDVEANCLFYSHDSEDFLSLTMQEQQQTRTRSVKLSRIASHDSDESFNERKSADSIPTRAHSAALQACLGADLRATAPRSSTIPSLTENDYRCKCSIIRKQFLSVKKLYSKTTTVTELHFSWWIVGRAHIQALAFSWR